jgi:hypothetical protein
LKTFTFFVKRNVFNSERAASDGVRLIIVLLVSGSQGQLVDEVQRNSSLTNTHLFRFEV